MTGQLTTLTSPKSPGDVADALVQCIKQRGMTVFARFNHAAAARVVGLTLRPTEVVAFGNPRAGTVLMEAAPTVALDLPLRALIWQDAKGVTCLTTEDPASLVARYALPDVLAPTITAMRTALAAVTQEAVHGPPPSTAASDESSPKNGK